MPAIPAIDPSLRNLFRKALRRAGFEVADVPSSDEAWDGVVAVEWRDLGTGTLLNGRHHVRIMLPQAFPFQKPQVLPLDRTPPLLNERHQEPDVENGALCLYPEQGETWSPWMTAEELLSRISVWFVHYHQKDWPQEDRPPDLHMYYPGKGSLSLMAYGDDWPPVMSDETGRFAVWLQPSQHRAFAANPVGPNQFPARTTGDRIAWNFGIAEAACTETGIWFRLQREPVPQQTFAGLLADIDDAANMRSGWSLQQVRALVGNRIRGKDRLLTVACVYPGVTQTEWLFLLAALPAVRKNEPRWFRRIAEIGVTSFAATPTGHAALMRRTGHTARTLAGKSVCIFGTGSIGSGVTMLLGKAGIELLHLVDHDTLRPGNAVRHAAGLQYVGFPKTLATMIECKQHFPDCKIERSHTTWDLDRLSQWIETADVVVDATASLSFSFLLNELCTRRNRPAVYVYAYRRATIGRIHLVRPSQDACLVCRAAHYAGTAEYVNIPPGDEGGFIDDGCGSPTVEASAVDIEAAANATARTVLHVLQGKASPANELLIVNEPLEGAEGTLSQQGHHQFAWKPVLGCKACGRSSS